MLGFPFYWQLKRFAHSISFESFIYHNLKLRKIVRAVRSSPQRRRAWLNEVNLSLRTTEEALADAEQTFVGEKPQIALMLILDVKTRWSSTHQMLHEFFVVQCFSF